MTAATDSHPSAHHDHAAHPLADRIVFRIARQDRPGANRYFQSFAVPNIPGMNVISALQYIAGHPVPLGEKQPTTPVAWDCNCLEEVCGACTMVINGRVRQACSALVDNLARNDAGEIELEPLSKFPIIRDLVVDRSRMFHALKRVRAWIPAEGYHDAGPGPRQSPGDQEEAYPLSTCMTCGCCLEACPQYTRIEVPREPAESDAEYAARQSAAFDQGFLGAAAISQAMLFNKHPTGAMNRSERLSALMGPGGITDCGNSQNCVKVCPKNIPLTRSIAQAGRDTSLFAIRRWLSR